MKTAGLIAAMAAAVAIPLAWFAKPQKAPAAGPETVEIAGGTISYRPIGNFHQGGKTVTPPSAPRQVGGFEIMKHQVSRASYAACVDDGACKPPDKAPDAPGLPQTHVNWHEAAAYAEWLSAATGQAWRLPDDAEWQLAAAELFGDAAGETADGDPAQRWLQQYAQGVTLRALPGPGQPAKGLEGNSKGVAGMGGNIWEWTSGCLQTGEVQADGRLEMGEPYCSARIAGGRHRAVVIDFIRDASVGGCAVGLPPDYLGFRLVKDG
ncbi:formylglycine-generating enzyme family protein [Roseobacteraceae bacterium NS-SX3]